MKKEVMLVNRFHCLESVWIMDQLFFLVFYLEKHEDMKLYF